MHTHVLRVVAIIFFLLFSSGLSAAATDDHYAWVLVETQYSNGSLTAGEWSSHPLGEFRPSHDFYQYYTRQDQRRAEFRQQAPGRTPNDPPQFMHGVYTWSAPPQIINPAEPVRIGVNQQVLSHATGGYSVRYSLRISLGHPWNMLITEPGHIAAHEYITVAFGASSPQFVSNDSVSVVFSREAWGAGREGDQREIRVSAGAGEARNISERYIYEWRQVGDRHKADILFGWLESLAPGLLVPAPQPTQHSEGLYYRYYPEANVFIATYMGQLWFIDHFGIIYNLGEVDFWLPVAQE